MRMAGILVLALMLGGCIQVGPSGPGGSGDAEVTTYTLNAPKSDAGEARAERGGAVIAVAKPELPPGFSTERIALYIGEPRRLDYYAGAKWSARLDDLLQDFIVRTARAELPGRIIDTPELGAKPRYRLSVKVTEFQPIYGATADAPPKLEAALTMTVVSLPDSNVKTRASVKREMTASANTQTAVTKALDELALAATREALQKVAPALR